MDNETVMQIVAGAAGLVVVAALLLPSRSGAEIEEAPATGSGV